MAGRKNFSKIHAVFLISLIIIFVILSFSGGISHIAEFLLEDVNISKNAPSESDNLEVHFIDVGQGDSIFIHAEDKNILIDAGENDKGHRVADYLRSENVEKLDILIGTHPHSDHIGGMDTVIENISVENLIIPDIPEEFIRDISVYSDVINTAEDKNVNIIKAVPYTEYRISENSKLTILAPLKSFKNINNNSIVTRLDYGEVSFLFTGDIEAEAEEYLIENLKDKSLLDTDVLDTPHHGSSTSSSAVFLKAVSPDYAVISCGKNNDFGHPDRKSLNRISEYTSEIYRTDLQGDIILFSDGKTISTNK